MATWECIWHKLYFPTEPVPTKVIPGPDDFVTSGMCRRCQRKFEGQTVRVHSQTPARLISAGAVDKFEESLHGH